MRTRSRLRENLDKQNKKTLVGIVLLVLLIGFFGMKFLIGFSVVLEKFRNPKDNSIGTQNVSYISPPIINPMEEATNSAQINVEGYSTVDNVYIELYVDDDLIGKTKPNADKSFTFKDVSLSSGKNTIKAKAINDVNMQSNFSQPIIISFTNKQPTLDISSPQNDQTFKKEDSPIKISGKSDPGDKVTVNDFWAITNNDGTFYYLYNLKDGDNNLKIVATDDAGNTTAKEIKIKVE